MLNEIYDLRPGNGSGVASSSSSSSSSSRSASTVHAGGNGTANGAGATIVSSAPSSSWSPSSSSSLYDGNSQRGEIMIAGATAHSSSAALSLNPSMIDSSALLTPTISQTKTSADNNTNRESSHWMIELIRSIPSHSCSIASASDISSDDIASVISSCCDDNASYSNSLCAPDVFGNIGRSLILASAASMGSKNTECDDCRHDTSRTPSPSLPSFSLLESGMATKWWDRLRTDEDWEVFRKKANEYMNTLIDEEMTRLLSNKVASDAPDCNSLDKMRMIKQVQQQQVTVKQGFLLWWLEGIRKSVHATIERITSNDGSAPSKYVSALVKEIVDIQQQLERLPPMPPVLPKELSLDDLPPESRKVLIQYSDSLNIWRRGVMPHQEELTARYGRCQEKLLAAIIDTEENMFYDNNNDEYPDAFGAVNDDGYIEVVEKQSSLWGVAFNETTKPSRGKCQFATFSAALVAALTAGAGVFLTLQTKRGNR